MSEAKGIWIDGRANKEEIATLQDLLKTACEKFAKNELPWHFQNEKITLNAVADGTTLHVFYGWNFPPLPNWKKTVDFKECENCDPDSKTPKREVWCEKKDYRFDKCPYGVPTAEGIASC
jgi:hypothetical protein